MALSKKAKGPRNMEEALGYLTGQFHSTKKAPHAIQVYGVTYLNQKALKKNLEILRDWCIRDFKVKIDSLIQVEDVDVRAAQEYKRESVLNLKAISNALISYVSDCVEFSDNDWDMKNYFAKGFGDEM